MTMEYGSSKASWGDAVITAAESCVTQMKTVWPSKSEAELYAMLGVTPMIGTNFNRKQFLPEHARQLVAWAKEKKVGHLAFWSLGRDNGNCAGGGISPDCSSVSQTDLEFTRIFQEYAGNVIDGDFPTQPTQKPTYPTNKPTNPTPKPTDAPTQKPSTEKPVTSKPTTAPVTSKPGELDCSVEGRYISHETDCNKYYWCYSGAPHLVQCAPGTIWDPKIDRFNFALDASRTNCK